MKVVQTINLTKKYGNKVIVDNVNLSVNKGDIYGLIGKNGAGKTTMIRMLCGLTEQNAGEIKLFENDKLNAKRKKIGTIIEHPALYNNMTALQNVLVIMKMLNCKDVKEAQNLLELVGLKESINIKAGKFSLGMKQRLAIAMSLVGNPQCLILDEPTNGLDPQGIKDVRDLIKTLNEKKQITILVSSHILSELSKLATRYGIINEGKLIDEFDENQMDQKSGKKIVIKTNESNKAVKLICEVFGVSKIEVTPNNEIFIYEKTNMLSRINKELVINNIDVTAIYEEKGDLEEYFIKQVGGNQ